MAKKWWYLVVMIALGSMVSYAQEGGRLKSFQKTADGTGYYRNIGIVENRDTFFMRLNYAKNSFNETQYKNIITGYISFVVPTIDISDSMKDTIIETTDDIWNKEEYYNPAIHNAAYEFIFPYKFRDITRYIVVVVLPQETWSTLDWAKAWNIM